MHDNGTTVTAALRQFGAAQIHLQGLAAPMAQGTHVAHHVVVDQIAAGIFAPLNGYIPAPVETDEPNGGIDARLGGGAE